MAEEQSEEEASLTSTEQDALRKTKEKELEKETHLRAVLGSVYTATRSAELNKTIASYTFDHYIEEAKRKIKGSGQEIRDAGGQALGIRPSKLEALEKLEKDFEGILEEARETAERADQTA